MRRAIILNNIRDVRHCVGNKLHHGNLLFSTDSNVDVYLKEFYNIKCQCLSTFFTIDEVIHLNNICSETVDKILATLDSNIAPVINRQFGLNIRYFEPLYAYFGRYHISGYIFFVNAIKKIAGIHGINRFSFYDCRFDEYFNVSTDMDYLAHLFFLNLEIEILRSSKRKESRYARSGRFIDILNKINQKASWTIKKALDKISDNIRYQRFANGKKVILLYETLGELEFLKQELSNYNILYYGARKTSPLGFKTDNSFSHISVDFRNFDFIEDKDSPFVQIFLKDIKEDFTRNIAGYIKSIRLLKEISKKYPVSLSIWGHPPISRLKTLIFEYLRSESIKVLGAQHGFSYGNCYCLKHFISDFGRCDYFISYGFTDGDLGRLYPKIGLDCKIMPFGKTKILKRKKAKRKIDIVFPITENLSMLGSGMVRNSPDKLAARQIRLLEYLNSLRGLSIYIKPLPFSNNNNFAVWPVFKRLKNLKVVKAMYFMEFLEVYEPSIILIELISTPLIECLDVDAEIFVMNDCINTFDEKALEELKKRVHYSDNVDEIIEKMDLFLKGKLAKRRDDTFYNHYVYKKDTQQNILQLVNSLVGLGKT